MNRNQWFVLSIGLIIFGSYMLGSSMAWGSCGFEGDASVICMNREYAYAIPGLISLALGFLFLFCAWLEPKKK